MFQIFEMEKTFKLLNKDNNGIKVFVYGTLMKGNSNYERFLADANKKINGGNSYVLYYNDTSFSKAKSKERRYK
ncbi:MAG: gamma-glutamylcyclotransferase (GGCT)/AIG2-like uncharacterized protein YtfP [Clostridium sp.]|jgi:gamma-glutamylcyclotransferase (GGCT)/AIG2-like uncharacterized protein YtfP